MKCPKCHYLSFDPEPRCRNCGYDLELSDDLELKTAEGDVEGPLADLTLRENDAPKRAPITLELVHPARMPAAESRSAAAAVALAERDDLPQADRAIAPDPPPPSAPVPPAAAMPASAVAASASSQPHDGVVARADAPPRRPSTTSELPLFVQGLGTQDGAHDRSMVAVPPVPRAPLSVRRAAPEPRARMSGALAERKLGPLDRDLLEDLRRVESEHRSDAKDDAESPARAFAESADVWDPVALRSPRRTSTSAVVEDDAPMLMRFGAAAIDAGVLGAIGLIVLLSTLRLCGLSTSQIAAVPLLPIAAFLLIVTVGYLLLFTIASGQTLGKMVLGLRVIGAPDAALTIRQAAFRELLSVPSVMALGAGYLPALLGRGQALHDKLAETRVVRA